MILASDVRSTDLTIAATGFAALATGVGAWLAGHKRRGRGDLWEAAEQIRQELRADNTELRARVDEIEADNDRLRRDNSALRKRLGVKPGDRS